MYSRPHFLREYGDRSDGNTRLRCFVLARAVDADTGPNFELITEISVHFAKQDLSENQTFDFLTRATVRSQTVSASTCALITADRIDAGMLAARYFLVALIDV